YYFKDGDNLKKELQYLLDNNITEKGEFQLTNALENMKGKGIKFEPGKVTEWLDCGNKDATVYTNQRVLEFDKGKPFLRGENIDIKNSIIIEPCFIGDNVKLHNSIVGPHASIGANSSVGSSIVKNSIIQSASKISNANISNSMLGEAAEVKGKPLDLSISDYTQIIV
ncbi:MAG TPA: nucleotidyltransferase, partial [Bacteroidia bacterium]|nr:nucleotidyltransferase [Bacteroidia bacterium]